MASAPIEARQKYKDSWARAIRDASDPEVRTSGRGQEVFLQSLLKHKDIEVAIKVRPMIKDIYYEEMVVKFPDINKLKIYDGKIEDVGKNFDVFIGSMSTAIIEGSLFGKISVLLNTLKFGDYYDIDSLIPGQSLLVRDPELLYEHIIDRVNNEHSLNTIEIIRKRFFGENKDGAQWIVEQL